MLMQSILGLPKENTTLGDVKQQKYFVSWVWKLEA